MTTSEDVEGYGRPFPYMIHKNMQYFKNKTVDEVIKVGDTDSDIQEGTNAGVLTVGADICVNNLKELTEYILYADKNPE